MALVVINRLAQAVRFTYLVDGDTGETVLGPDGHTIVDADHGVEMALHTRDVLIPRKYVTVSDYGERKREVAHPIDWVWLPSPVRGHAALTGGVGTVTSQNDDITGAGSGVGALTGEVHAGRRLNGTVSGASSLTGTLAVTATVRIVPTDLTSETSHSPFVISHNGHGSFIGSYGNDYIVFDDSYTPGDNNSIFGTQFGFSAGDYGALRVDTGGSYTLTQYRLNLEEGGFGGNTTGYQWAVYGSNDAASWIQLDAENIATGNPVHTDLDYNVTGAASWRYFELRMLRGDPAPGVCQQAKIGKWIIWGHT